MPALSRVPPGVPASQDHLALERRMRAQAQRWIARWRALPAHHPERFYLWFTYHCYYRKPDWLGPIVTRAPAVVSIDAAPAVVVVTPDAAPVVAAPPDAAPARVVKKKKKDPPPPPTYFKYLSTHVEEESPEPVDDPSDASGFSAVHFGSVMPAEPFTVGPQPMKPLKLVTASTTQLKNKACRY